MQALPIPNPVAPPEGNPAGNPHREPRQLTPEDEMAIVAAKRRFEEMEKSNQYIPVTVRIISSIAATVAFASVKVVESSFVTAALMIVGIASVIFFLLSFSSYLIPTVYIPLHLNVLIKAYDLKNLHREFDQMVQHAEGTDLNPDDELVSSIRGKINFITEKMEELENILRDARDQEFQIDGHPQLGLDTANFYRTEVAQTFSNTKTFLNAVNSTLQHNPPPNYKENFIKIMKKTSEKINTFLPILNQLSIIYL